MNLKELPHLYELGSLCLPSNFTHDGITNSFFSIFRSFQSKQTTLNKSVDTGIMKKSRVQSILLFGKNLFIRDNQFLSCYLFTILRSAISNGNNSLVPYLTSLSRPCTHPCNISNNRWIFNKFETMFRIC